VYGVLAWFSDRPEPGDAVRAGLARFQAAAAPLIPESYLRREAGGDDWGLSIVHAPDPGAYRWPIFAQHGQVTAVSLGLPVGVDTTGGPLALARRLLAGQDVHADAVPPFTMIATEGGTRVVIQQDWLGMGRVFTGTADGITAVCTRPSLLAAFLWGRREPDVAGWLAYTASGQFGGDMSPIRGVRLLKPGERLTTHRRAAGGWEMTSEIRRNADDVVADGVAAQHRGADAAIDLAAEGMRAIANSVFDLYADEVTLGLSGGRDSRVVAAAFLAAGKSVAFETNADQAAEGEMAQRLMSILADRRGLTPQHRVFRAGQADVLSTGLYERTVRLQDLFDFQFPSSYIERRAVVPRLPVRRAASLSGAGGELGTAYWYPEDDSGDLDVEVARRTAVARLVSVTPPRAVPPEQLAAERARITALVDHGAGIGLRGLATCDYVFLMERGRRWTTSAYGYGRVTPLLSPSFVTASFALIAADKRRCALHHGVLDRLMPEWSEVPFVHGANAGTSTAPSVWDGDGIQTMSDLLDTTGGPLTELIKPTEVRAVLRQCVNNGPIGRQKAALLRQFTYLAVATHMLVPEAVRDVQPTTYAKLTTPRRQVPPLARSAAKPFRFVRRTRLGRRIWSSVRDRMSG
jgi:asparagine synthase (glutamine-hydrolysing)